MPITLTGNRFLITTYKAGGENGYAKLVPLRNDAAPSNQLERWWTARPAHRYGENGGVFSEAVVKTALSATTLGTTPHDYALHPSYSSIMPVWSAGDLAIVPSIGVMEEPLPDRVIDIPNFRNIYKYPQAIGAHDKFQVHHTFMNGRGEQTAAGWIGRVMDYIASAGGLSTALAGIKTIVINPGVPSAQMHRGVDVIPFTLPRFGPNASTVGVPVSMVMRAAGVEANVRTKLLEAIALAADPTSVRHNLWKDAATLAFAGASAFQPLQNTLLEAGTPDTYEVDVHFTGMTDRGWWMSMFHRTARIIEAAWKENAGANPIRMALSLSIGDYDTHSEEKARFEGNATFTSLAVQYGQGVAAFRAAMLALDGTGQLWKDCVITDPTDFGRTLWTSGGSGTDHAWDYAMFVAGGLVRGQGKDGSTGLLGPYPDVISTDITGTRDWNKGGIRYPYRSLEEVYDPILEWFGLTVGERNIAMPNRTRFSNFIDVLDI